MYHKTNQMDFLESLLRKNPGITLSSEELDIVVRKLGLCIYPNITDELYYEEMAKICANLTSDNPSYALLGGNILIDFHDKQLIELNLRNFSQRMRYLSPFLNDHFIGMIEEYEDELNKMIDYDRNRSLDYFGFKTCTASYLLKSHDKIIETPQDMYLRVACQLSTDLAEIKQTYDLLSTGYYTHASPTMFNSGTRKLQCSSCFLLGVDDNLEDIANCWRKCSLISKWSGGIGLHVSNIRGKNSIIRGTNGRSNGIIPFLKVFNDIARWIDQGGKRPGSIAIYLEPHHPDIYEFLDLKKNFGAETERARDLFLSLYISDLFMNAVEKNLDWYLLSEDDAPGLSTTYGEAYETLYASYVSRGLYRKKISARHLWLKIIEAQIETGTPYIGFKDSINRYCNQKNLGTIRSSNLCHEITEYSDSKEVAVCNLGSIAVNKCLVRYKFENVRVCCADNVHNRDVRLICTFLKNQQIPYEVEINDGIKIYNNNVLIGSSFGEFLQKTACSFDFDKLYEVAYQAVKNLDKIIDINYYPIEEAKFSNMRHRPIGLGIQGVADALVQMRLLFESPEALKFSAQMMETIYLASVTASIDLAKQRHEPMKRLKELIQENLMSIPEYYDETYKNPLIDAVYHQLQPCIYEIESSGNHPGAYSTFEGSPFSKGLFQFDLYEDFNYSSLCYPEKWNKCRQDIQQYGIRNSLLTALMPTASTSQILGNNECFEYFTNNIYTRKTLAGDFTVVNKYLLRDLKSLGLYDTNMKNEIIKNDGSVQSIRSIPWEIRQYYKIIWEIKQIYVLKHATRRAPFVDQAQSMNIFIGTPDNQKLTSSHFYAWKNKLKTGMYYLRTKPAATATKITLTSSAPKFKITSNTSTPDECTNCSS
jgi:ribonucleoside-diphosphate reductase alpha chain